MKNIQEHHMFEEKTTLAHLFWPIANTESLQKAANADGSKRQQITHQDTSLV